MKIRIKKINEEAVLPTKAHDIDAGYDMTGITSETVNEKDYGYVEYGTGIAMEIPVGYVGLMFPRSSISKTGLILSNSVGCIDPGYLGEIKFRFKYIPGTEYYKPGDRVGQLIVIPTTELEFEEVEELETTERGEGGFGSTGKGKLKTKK